MFTKFSYCAFIALGLISFSCNRADETKNNSTTPPSASTTATAPQMQAPANSELMNIESKFAQDSSNYDLRMILAAAYYSAGVLDQAAYHFSKVYEHDNKNLIALSNLGNIYYDSQQDDKAIQFYEKALVLDPKNINMRCDLATCYSRINKLKK